MISAMAVNWEKNLRRLIKYTHGQGWSLRQKGLGATQVTRRWSDNSRSSATVRIPWKRSSGPKLLAVVERLAIAIAPEAEGGQGLTLARAAELIQLRARAI
ncbi:possible phage integrase family [Synechococcus sp. CC9605]|nr:possible phage integrase family [Synechococcus sp. CC9605]